MLRREATPLVLVALGVVAAFLGCLLASTEGHFVPQVTDLYLVCQYAKAMAEGHPFRYNPGDAPSTGATSLLHTTVLAVAHALGARGEGLVAVAILLGAGCLIASTLLARRIAGRLASGREGLLAGLLVALGGPVTWGFLYGSDTAPAMLLTLWLLDTLLTAWLTGRCLGLAIAGSLLALTRPEGLPVAMLAGGWLLLRRKGIAPRQAMLALVPVATGLTVLVLNRVLTGLWLGTSVADKSLLANYSFRDAVALSTEYLVDALRGLLLGLYPSFAPVGFSRGWAALYFPPLGLLLVLLAVARADEASRPVLRVWLFVTALFITLAAPNVFMGVHYNRYLLPVLPSLLVLLAVGLGSGSRLAAQGAAALDGSLYRTGTGLLLALSLLSTARFATLYGEGAGEVYRRDLKAAEWIRGNLPHGVAMANVVTSVEYLTGHKSLNLHGVSSPAFFGNRSAEREAGTFEALGRLPWLDRPEYLITSVATQEANASLRELVEPAPLFRTLSLGDEILVHRMSWTLAGKNARLFRTESLALSRELREVDSLNVCDARDEAVHAYSHVSRVGDVALHGSVRVGDYPGPPTERVADAGRVIVGSESFLVRGTAPGRDLVVLMRTAPSHTANLLRASGRSAQVFAFPEAGLRLFAGGREAAHWRGTPRDGWDEVVLRVPGTLVGAPDTRLTLRGRYASFYFWFLQ
jgi:hypothetical protein